MKVPHSPLSHPLKNCNLVRVPDRQGIPAANQPEPTPEHPWDGLVLSSDPHAGDFKVVTAKLDGETTAVLQKNIAEKAARASQGPFVSWAMHAAEGSADDLSRANGVAYEVPIDKPKTLGTKVKEFVFGPEGREPQAWLLVDGKPIVDHDLAEQKLPPRTTL